MQHLLVDLGHSRIKWVELDLSAHKWSPQASFYTPETLQMTLFSVWSPLTPPDQIFISNVCTLQEKNILNAWIGRHWPNANIQYPESDLKFSKIQNAYREAPKTLGVDRWLGIIATHYLYPETNAVIIDCGTCITLDVLSIKSQHLGGWIVPGYTLLRQLLQTRAGLPAPILENLKTSPVLGDNTLMGIEHGISLMFLGYLKEALQSVLKNCENPPQIVLTGGDAPYYYIV